jgi:GT2 family glycosyltransferase
MKLISVIIPTCHRNDLLAKCLEPLAPGRQSLEVEAYEVIVTDDGQRTTAQAMIAEHYPWARWVPGPKRGPAANRNHGATAATGEWLAFIDDDCIPSPEWLSAYRAAIQKTPGVHAFEGAVHPEDRPRQRHDEVAPINLGGGCFWSCNILVKRSLFHHIAGFNESFPSAAMEDIELKTRLQKNGELIVFARDAKICHPWRVVYTAKQAKAHQRCLLLYYRLHPDQAPDTQAVAIHLLRSLTAGFYRQFLKSLPTCRLRGLRPALWNFFLDIKFQCSLLILCLLGRKPWLQDKE